MKRSVVVVNSALVAGPGVVHLLGHGQLVLGAVAVGGDDDPAHALAALVAHEVAGEGGHALELHVGTVGDELLPVLAAEVVDRRGDELEVHRVVGVGEDHEAVLVGRRRVGGVVLDALLAGLDHPRRAGGVGGRDEVLLRGHLRRRGDVHPLPR